jgi:hypothetical protein
MNVPGRPNGNWRWRCTEAMLSNAPFEWLHDLTRVSNRSNDFAQAPLVNKSATNQIEVNT